MLQYYHQPTDFSMLPMQLAETMVQSMSPAVPVNAVLYGGQATGQSGRQLAFTQDSNPRCLVPTTEEPSDVNMGPHMQNLEQQLLQLITMSKASDEPKMPLMPYGKACLSRTASCVIADSSDLSTQPQLCDFVKQTGRPSLLSKQSTKSEVQLRRKVDPCQDQINLLLKLQKIAPSVPRLRKKTKASKKPKRPLPRLAGLRKSKQLLVSIPLSSFDNQGSGCGRNQIETKKNGKNSNESSMTKSNETSRSLIVSLNFDSPNEAVKASQDLKRPHNKNQIADILKQDARAPNLLPVSIQF